MLCVSTGATMELKYPETILICHDDYHAQYIGRTSDGNQFFLTTPFVPASEDEGCEFIALYKLDSNGALVSSQIENLGPREAVDGDLAQAKLQSILGSLRGVEYGDINIQPFEVEEFGVRFGLIPIDPELVEGEEEMLLEIQPGNYMAFYPPWDGDYDT